MRKDLGVRKGKMVAQGSHAVMKVFFSDISWPAASEPDGDPMTMVVHFSTLKHAQDAKAWLDGIFTKICVSVNSEAELDAIYAKAKEAGLPCSMIVDSGATEFHGVPTKTCCAIGPAESGEIDLITGGLPLL